MRYSADHRRAARARIVAAAAVLLRERGILQPTVAAIMARTGRTHGGFYHHFSSRDALIAAAVEGAARETAARVFEEAGDAPTMLATYLSSAHVATPGEGCVLAAVGTEGVRSDARVIRRAFARAARGFIAHVDRVLARRPSSSAPAAPHAVSDEALVLAARMVGAVVLARLVRDAALADRILASARQS